jgi:rhodanese-related sulfurtransferase
LNYGQKTQTGRIAVTTRTTLVVALLIALLAAALVGLAGCGGSGGPPAVPLANADALWTAIFATTPPDVVDVRSADAYALFHIPNSRSDPGGASLVAHASAAAVSSETVIVAATEADEATVVVRVNNVGGHTLALSGGLDGWAHGLDISAQTLKGWMDADRTLQLIDVRTQAEWTAKHIPGTANKPLDQLETWSATLSKQAEIVCICAAGSRSTQARNALAQKGFARVDNLLGGTNGWPYALQGTECG